MKYSPLVLALAIAFSVPSMAPAHHGDGIWGGLSAGLTHPLSGLDHLLALLATGLWAAQRGGRWTWAIPLTFITVMAIGGGLGILGIGFPLVETGVTTSVLLIGVMVAAAVRLPIAISMAIIGLFALCHGHAHGTEMPLFGSSLNYFVGFLTTSALLLAATVVSARQVSSSQVIRWAGASVAACGVLMLLA